MKLIILILLSGLALLTVVSVNAQTPDYHPYPSTYATWLYKHMPVPMSSETYYCRTVWSGDTLINGEHYLKVYQSYTSSHVPAPMAYIGGIRQDIAAQSMYFVTPSGDEHDITINQFLETGDTILNTPYLGMVMVMIPDYMNISEITKFVVTEAIVQPSNIGNRRVYTLQPIDADNEPVTWADPVQFRAGIGSYDISWASTSIEILCHTIVDDFVFGEEESNPYGYSCLLDISEPEQGPVISISPNPSAGTFKISVGDAPVQMNVTIADLSGRIILNKENFMSDQFWVTDLETGSYLIYFTYEERLYTRSFTVER